MKTKKKWGTNFSPTIHEYILVVYGHTHRGYRPVSWKNKSYYMTEEEAFKKNYYISVYSGRDERFDKKHKMIINGVLIK